MAPVINVSERDYERASKILELARVEYSTPSNDSDSKNINLIHVPSIGYDVSRERTGFGRNWSDSHMLEGDSVMLSQKDWTEFLIYARDNEPEVYEDITAVRSPWRAEWIDGYFEKRDDGLYMLKENRTIAEKLDEDTLMEDRRISLDSWLDNPTPQGLPRTDTTKGDLYYWCPKKGAVAGFGASSDGAVLDSNGYPLGGGSDLGVRSAIKRE